MSWTDARNERLKDLWPDAKTSATNIAEILNREFPEEQQVSRSAVLGRASRLNLQKRREVGRAEAVANGGSAAPRARTSSRPTMDFKRRRSANVVQLPPFPFRGDPTPAEPEPRHVTLLELNADTCRWPIGDPHSRDFYFCGAVPEIDRAYCPFHCRIAYQPRG